jgi:hypothetical protein
LRVEDERESCASSGARVEVEFSDAPRERRARNQFVARADELFDEFDLRVGCLR